MYDAARRHSELTSSFISAYNRQIGEVLTAYCGENMAEMLALLNPQEAEKAQRIQAHAGRFGKDRTHMRLSTIQFFRQAGLSDDEIAKLLDEADAEEVQAYE